MDVPQFNNSPIVGHFTCLQFLIVKATMKSHNVFFMFLCEPSFPFGRINAQKYNCWLYDKFMFRVLRNCKIILQSACTIVYYYQQGIS